MASIVMRREINFKHNQFYEADALLKTKFLLSSLKVKVNHYLTSLSTVYNFYP